MSFKVQFIIS